jgi:hypothetical protein
VRACCGASSNLGERAPPYDCAPLVGYRSGRTGSPRKRVRVHALRGFKSHPHRVAVRLRSAGLPSSRCPPCLGVGNRGSPRIRHGDVRERPNRHAWKACDPARGPRVQIPPSPQQGPWKVRGDTCRLQNCEPAFAGEHDDRMRELRALCWRLSSEAGHARRGARGPLYRKPSIRRVDALSAARG